VTSRTKLVLVVEDHDDTREMVELFLQHEGYEVCTAENGVAALECVAEAPPCLILLDVMMPVMDGPTFAARLRASPDHAVAETPIVLLTAAPNARDVQRQIGALEIISKPISLDRVTATVRRHCQLR
jgi:CheY-like chemotaxis protein